MRLVYTGPIKFLARSRETHWVVVPKNSTRAQWHERLEKKAHGPLSYRDILG